MSGRIGGGQFGDGLGFGHQLVRRREPIRQPHIERLAPGIEPRRQAHLAGATEAHALHQKVRTGELRRNAHLHEHHSELGLFGSDDDVHGQDHRRANANAGAVDRGDERLRGTHEFDPIAGRFAGRCLLGLVLSAAFHAHLEVVADVGAGAETSAGAGHHHRADVRVFVAVGDGGVKVSVHLPRPSVQALGPIQGDDGDVVGFL